MEGIFDAALEWLRELGLPRARLHLHVDNARAERFYARCGFALTGDPSGHRRVIRTRAYQRAMATMSYDSLNQRGRVRILGPSGVTATVCSTWAARLPSALRSVQPSASTV